MKVLFSVILCCVLALAAQSQEFSGAESIVWNPVTSEYIVSNSVNGNLISVNEFGEKKNFGTAGTASHGLAIMNGILYSCSKNSIHAHSLDLGAQLGSWAIPGAVFLNGLCSNGSDRLFATDFTTKKVFVMSLDAEGDILVNDEILSPKMPNGITYDPLNQRLIFVSWGKDATIYDYDLAHGRLSTLKETTYSNLESVILDGKGNAYVTGWIPSHLLRLDLEDRSIEEMNIYEVLKPTGMTFTPKGDLILLSSSTNSWSMVKVNDLHSGIESDISAFPNPMITNSMITYKVEKSGPATICVYDCQGRMIERHEKDSFQTGFNQFLLKRSNIPAGLYFVNVQTDTTNEAIPLTITD